jgi:hypothetical protein
MTHAISGAPAESAAEADALAAGLRAAGTADRAASAKACLPGLG